MLALGIIVAYYVVGHFILKWAYTPTRNFTPEPGRGKSIKPPKDVFDLMYPKLER